MPSEINLAPIIFSQELHKQTDEELNTLRRAVSQKEEESRQRQSLLESKIQELEVLQSTLPRGKSENPYLINLCLAVSASTNTSKLFNEGPFGTFGFFYRLYVLKFY